MNALLSRRHKDVDSTTFKAVMRQLAASVVVVTSRNGDRLNGMTATAVCSVSAEPPLVLVVVNTNSSTHPMIGGSQMFALNILREDQTEIANYFARREDKDFDDVPYIKGMTGCPLLRCCAASIECVVHSAFETGSHTIFVGRIVNALTQQAVPLLYYNGQFARIAGL
jgi:flavin reductase